MDHYTIMLVVDPQSPVRRFQLPKARVRQAAISVGVVFTILAVAVWDYTRMRADNAELDGLRIEVAEQREQIDRFEGTLAAANTELANVRELERKVRIIANLPGAAGIGGEGVTELAPPLEIGAQGEPELMPPAGVPIDLSTHGGSEASEEGASAVPGDSAQLEREALTTEAARHIDGLRHVAEHVSTQAGARTGSLEELVKQLEDKRHRLASMPSIWPAKGWLTSRFGPRVSPFTGRRQLHAGIDIAARAGSPIASPASGRIKSIGSSGPLGNSVMVDHGFGVRTFYGHAQEIFVKVGDEVERGQKIAAVGSTGRSTGPHLHYSVHVSGKATDPLDYIFD
jgi:murein DD-endopeptidase MepM/ murein hydrolase activator NlpD